VKRSLAMLGALAAMVGAAEAAAAEPGQAVTLTWRAPGRCPAREDVEAEIRSALAHLQGHGTVEVAAEVTERPAGAGFALRVRVLHDGQTGERLLPLENCDDASRAAALLVVLSVGNPQPPPLPAPPPPPPPRPAALPSPTTRERLAPWTVGLGPRLAWGVAPELSAGLGLSFSYGQAFWRFSARAAAFAPSSHDLPGKQLGGSFRLLTGGLFACAGHPGRVTLYGCVGGRVDRLSAEGTGGSASFEQSATLGALAAGLTLEWTLTRRFRLRTELEAGYPLADARFVIRNEPTPVHEVKDLRAEAGLELAAAF
jgi:hypothetical protein